MAMDSEVVPLQPAWPRRSGARCPSQLGKPFDTWWQQVAAKSIPQSELHCGSLDTPIRMLSPSDGRPFCCKPLFINHLQICRRTKANGNPDAFPRRCEIERQKSALI